MGIAQKASREKRIEIEANLAKIFKNDEIKTRGSKLLKPNELRSSKEIK